MIREYHGWRAVESAYSKCYVNLIRFIRKMTTDKSKRTPCEVFTRVMGYLRPVSNYNVWKKSEFYSRKYFDEKKIDNSEFLAKYSNQWQK